MIRKIPRIRIRYPHAHTTPLTYRTWNRPPPVALPVITRSWQFIPEEFPPRATSVVLHNNNRRLAIGVSFICVCLCVHYIYCFSPLFLPIDVATAAGASPLDRLLRRRPYPYRRASRQAVPLHLSSISPICLYLSVALGIGCCYDKTYSIA